MPKYTNLVLKSSDYCVEDAINYINKFIVANDIKDLCIDISAFNFLEATHICILSSTFSFNKNPENKLTWLVNSNHTQEAVERLKLSNMNVEVKKQTPFYTALSA